MHSLNLDNHSFIHKSQNSIFPLLLRQLIERELREFSYVNGNLGDSLASIFGSFPQKIFKFFKIYFIEHSLHNLVTLNLQKNNLSHLIERLGEILQNTDCRLVELNLSQNQCGDQIGGKFLQCLFENRRLESLNLSGNRIGKEGELAFLQLVSINTTLKALNLSNNQLNFANIPPQHPFFIQTFSNWSLQKLDLSRNFIEANSLVVVSRLLKQTPRLLDLNLNFNQFGKDGILKFLGIIYSNETLTSLKICDFDASKENEKLGSYLLAFLSQNSTLSQLHISTFPNLKRFLSQANHLPGLSLLYIQSISQQLPSTQILSVVPFRVIVSSSEPNFHDDDPSWDSFWFPISPACEEKFSGRRMCICRSPFQPDDLSSQELITCKYCHQKFHLISCLNLSNKVIKEKW